MCGYVAGLAHVILVQALSPLEGFNWTWGFIGTGELRLDNIGVTSLNIEPFLLLLVHLHSDSGPAYYRVLLDLRFILQLALAPPQYSQVQLHRGIRNGNILHYLLQYLFSSLKSKNSLMV